MRSLVGCVISRRNNIHIDCPQLRSVDMAPVICEAIQVHRSSVNTSHVSSWRQHRPVTTAVNCLRQHTLLDFISCCIVHSRPGLYAVWDQQWLSYVYLTHVDGPSEPTAHTSTHRRLLPDQCTDGLDWVQAQLLRRTGQRHVACDSESVTTNPFWVDTDISDHWSIESGHWCMSGPLRVDTDVCLLHGERTLMLWL